jgi:ATP-binding cassette, subfamily B, bacterial HlyB/CyaB
VPDLAERLRALHAPEPEAVLALLRGDLRVCLGWAEGPQDLPAARRFVCLSAGGGGVLLERRNDGSLLIDVGGGRPFPIVAAVLEPVLPCSVVYAQTPVAPLDAPVQIVMSVYLRLVGQLLALATPIAMLLVIDRVVGNGAENTLVALVIGVSLLTLLQFAFLGASALQSVRAVEARALPARRQVIDTLLGSRIAPRWAGGGWDAIQQAAEASRYREEVRPQAMTDAIFVVLLSLLMMAFSPLLTVVVLAFVPAYLGIGALGTRSAQRYAAQAAGGRSGLSGLFFEAVAATETVRALDVAGHVGAQWGRLDESVAASRYRMALSQRLTALAVELLQKLALVVTMLLGVSAVIAGALTLGQYIAFNLLSMQLAQPLLRLAAFRRARADHALAEQSRGELQRACHAEAWPESAPLAGSEALFDRRPVVIDVSGVPPSGLSFRARGGQWIGVTGASGCGKSTLLRSIAGLDAPPSGRVLINGQAVTRVHLPTRARQIRLVGQQPVVFGASLAENIRLGDPAATPAQIALAADVAGLTAVAERWADHLNTVVGATGRTLSGGEAQWLCLARAIVCRPAVLLLDECTAALDAAAEAELFARLRLLLPDTLVVLVSHRATSLAACGRVLRVDAPHGPRLVTAGAVGV